MNHSDKKTLITHFNGCKNIADNLLDKKIVPKNLYRLVVVSKI